MNLDPDDLARILRGARKCGDNHRDEYFRYVAERLKFFNEPLPQIIDAALKRGQIHSKRPK
jgi:hypothetical protein